MHFERCVESLSGRFLTGEASIDLPIDEVVPFYYSRQAAEQLFKFSKDDLELLPLRTHNEESMRGYLLLVFITLIVFFFPKELGI